MGINDERRRRITLDETSILEAARPEFDFGEKFNFDVPDDALVGEDIGLYIDSEGNLVDYAPTLGIAGSSDGLLVPQVSGMAVSLGKHSRDVEDDRYHPTGDPDFMQIGDILYMPQDQEQIIDPNLQLDFVAVQRQPKSMKLIIDDHTMLPRENILESEENFQLNQTALIQKRRLKQNIAYARECIVSFMSRPLGVSGYGPDLEAFWGSASVRTIATLSTGQLHNAAPQVEQFDDGPFLFDTEQDMLPEPPEPEEVRRRQMSVDTATSMDLGGGGFGLGGSRIVGHMPWSVDLHASVSAQSEHSSAGSEYLRREFEAAFDKAPGRPTQGQRARLGGLNEESLMRSRNTRRGRSRSQTGSRDISRGTSRQRANSVDAGGSGSSMSGYDPFSDLVGQHEDITMYQQNPGVTPSQLVVERETVNFIEYVRSILREANTNSFSFEDVITIHRRRDVAASAFYHILSLSTMGKMYPTQDAPYQDIQVELTE
ncbi:hypothetical protein BGZ49_008423 [Haplosporangium sp. Z 27]|nr:hypothetical protein BGZ49_008423 [Haplosporangium sp. Z 27]